MTVELVEIAGCMHVAPELARLHAEEWSHLYPEWDERAALAEFEAMTEPGRVPTTWVAFDGPDRSIGGVLGSVSLILDDELVGHRSLGPWLASLYVMSTARRLGVGGLLVDRVVGEAHRLGIERLYLFTAGQEEYYERRGWRTVSRPPMQGHDTALMLYDTWPNAPRRAAVSRWCSNPHVGGAYSFLRVGGTSADRERMSEPIAVGLHLAGEATSAAYPGTAHGAWFSGERAAAAAIAERDGEPGAVAVVGAGLAGIAAARRFGAAGWQVTVFEAGEEPGGRVRVDRSLGAAAPLGATWAHGTDGNPFLELARRVGVDEIEGVFDAPATFVAGHGIVGDADQRRLGQRFTDLERSLLTMGATGGDRPVGPALRTLLDAIEEPLDHAALACWFRGEFENLYAAPVDELSLQTPTEAFRLPGPDVMLACDLGRAVTLAVEEIEGIDLRLGSVVTGVRRTGDGWAVDAGSAVTHRVDAVVVTVPIGVLQRGLIEFSPPLPADLTASIDRIGAGPVAKAFFTFDTAWWAPHRAFWAAGPEPLLFELWVDVSPILGRPALCAFAVGDAALAAEAMSEDELCAAAGRVLRDVTCT